MKLIDLLVQELPKRGGWPDGVKEIVQGSAGTLFDMESQDGERLFEGVRFDITEDRSESIVNYEQYATALIASWNGEGLPPVGCECEALYDSNDEIWLRAKIIALDSGFVIGRWLEGSTKLFEYVSPEAFRPIRSEADKNRDEAIAALVDFKIGYHSYPKAAEEYLREVTELYDAIAAGKISGIKLE